MTATNQHISNSGRGNTHQTSHQYRIIKGLAKMVGCIIGLIVALIMWVVAPTDTPRCGVANLHTDDDSDNLLVNDTLKYYDYGKKE